MDVKFLNDYQITTTTTSVETFEECSSTLLDDFISWSGDDRYDDEDCLREAFTEYILDYAELTPEINNSNIEVEDYSIDFKLVNWEEIFPVLEYMIEAPKEITCCDKAPFGSNFCPTCGNRLIKK